MTGMNPRNARKDGSIRNKAKSPSSEKESSESQNFTASQFINVTNSTALDESARTTVRAQVMRDYHRRRVQKTTQNEHSTLGSTPKPPSAKAQTHKFRFGKEKGLRPWVPVKGSPKKRRKTSEGQQNRLDLKKPGQPSNTSVSTYRSQLPPILAHSNQTLASASFQESKPIAASADQWLSSLAFAIQTSTLFRAPGSGFLDPFAATSLLITPRTQVLIHHYCKFCPEYHNQVYQIERVCAHAFEYSQ